MPDYWCCLSVLTFKLSERQRERENWELPRPEAGVETDLEIAQSNCCANHTWCIRNCLERYRKVVNRDWCHMSFGIILVNHPEKLLLIWGEIFTLGDTTNGWILLINRFPLINHRYACIICSLEFFLFLRLEIRNKLTWQANAIQPDHVIRSLVY